MTVRHTDVATAHDRIRSRVRRTPVLLLDDDGLPGPVQVKLECFQHTGSFKARGAFNRVLSAQERAVLPDSGVIVASGGNAAMAVAHAARELGVRAEVFVPESSSAVKRERIQEYGAQVTVTGAHYADTYEACLVRAEESGALLVHAYDQPEVVAGQGSVAVELLEQLHGELDTVLVAVGGGGLAAGIVAGLAGRASVVTVEPVTIPTYHEAKRAGRPVEVPVSGVAADSLGARILGSIAWDLLEGVKAEAVLVDDQAIVDARRWLWNRCRLAVEPGGAAALAALLCGAYKPATGERVAVVLCGANTDPGDLATPHGAAGGLAPLPLHKTWDERTDTQ